MKYEFHGKSLADVVRKAIALAPERKFTAEVWAPPLFWSGWYQIEDAWGRRGRDIHLSVSFSTLSDAPSSFDVELAHGAAKSDVLSTSGPGSAEYIIPHDPDGYDLVTALYMRAKSHSFGQLLDVQVSSKTVDRRSEAETAPTHYIWRTRQDGKVRPSHAANHGKVFAWDEPPATGHPGEDYECRCRAEPYNP